MAGGRLTVEVAPNTHVDAMMEADSDAGSIPARSTRKEEMGSDTYKRTARRPHKMSRRAYFPVRKQVATDKGMLDCFVHADGTTYWRDPRKGGFVLIKKGNASQTLLQKAEIPAGEIESQEPMAEVKPEPKRRRWPWMKNKEVQSVV